jgi:Flp pilus assembly protein TadG
MTRARVMLKRLRKAAECQSGAAAVELALIAIPFVALLVAMVETALVFFAGQVLQEAATQSGRLVMTGQAVGMTSSQFQQAVCNHSSGLFDCTKLSVSVQTFNSFSSITRTSPVSGGKILSTSSLPFSPGTPGQIEVVQVFYPWPLGADALGLGLINVNGDSHLLTGTAVFRNEPY